MGPRLCLLTSPNTHPSRPGPCLGPVVGNAHCRRGPGLPARRPRLPGGIPRESEEGQVRLRALPRAVGGSAKVRHRSPPAGRPSAPLPASSGQPARPSGPGRGARPACRLGRAGAPGGGAGGREAARGRRGAAVLGRARDAAPQCCERPGGFTAAAAGAPPARPGRYRLLPTMHPGARGCPLFTQLSSSAPFFPPTSLRASMRPEARLPGCGEVEAGPGTGCHSAPAQA